MDIPVLNFFLYLVLGLVAVLCGIAVLMAIIITPILIIDGYKMRRRGDLKRQRDMRFSNTVYLCENPDCDRKFFRMYHIFEAYKRNLMTIPGEPVVDELSYAHSVRVKWAEKLGICRCPDCHSDNIIRTKQFEWMDTSPAFPKLDNEQLKMRRKIFNNPVLEEEANESLEAIRQAINEMDSIAAYQHNYELSGPNESDTAKRLQSIQEQLELFRQTTFHPKARETAGELLQQLGVTSKERYSMPQPGTTKPVDNGNDLQEELAAVKLAEEALRTSTEDKRPRNYLDDERYHGFETTTVDAIAEYHKKRQAVKLEKD